MAAFYLCYADQNVFYLSLFESLGIAMATYCGQNYGAGKAETYLARDQASGVMMLIYALLTFVVLMVGGEDIGFTFCRYYRTGNIEKYGVVFARICLFLSFPGIALYSAIYHSGSGIYQSCYAFRSFRNDSTHTGQYLCRTGIRLYCSLFSAIRQPGWQPISF